MGKQEGNDTWSTLKRLHRLVELLARRGEAGVAFDEIRENIYEGDHDSDSLRRKFNRDKNNLRKLYGDVLEDSEIDGEDLDKVVLIEKNAAGRYVMKSRFNFMLPMTLDEKELLVLISGVSLAKHFLFPFSKASESLEEKLKRQIPEKFLAKSKKIAEAVASTVPIAEGVSEDVFMKVLDAIEKKKVLKIGQYTERDGHASSCTLSPHLLFHKFHSWYVVGESPDKKDLAQPAFRLDRMKAVSLLDEDQPQPLSDEELEKRKKNIALDFNPAKPDETYHVKLRITGSFARPCMETEWFPGEKKTWEERGKSVLYEVELMGLEAITLWIMRALDCVEVLEPKKLADEIDRRVGAYLERKNKGRTR